MSTASCCQRSSSRTEGLASRRTQHWTSSSLVVLSMTMRIALVVGVIGAVFVILAVEIHRKRPCQNSRGPSLRRPVWRRPCPLPAPTPSSNSSSSTSSAQTPRPLTFLDPWGFYRVVAVTREFLIDCRPWTVATDPPRASPCATIDADASVIVTIITATFVVFPEMVDSIARLNCYFVIQMRSRGQLFRVVVIEVVNWYRVG